MSTLPRDGFGERVRGRRKPLIIGGVVLTLIVVWSYVVLSLTAARSKPGVRHPKGGGATAQTTAPAVPDEPAYAEVRQYRWQLRSRTLRRR